MTSSMVFVQVSSIFPLSERVDDVLMLCTHLFKELVLYAAYLVYGYVMHQAVHATIKDGDLLSNGHRTVLWLDEQLVVLTAAVDGHGGDGVHIA